MFCSIAAVASCEHEIDESSLGEGFPADGTTDLFDSAQLDRERARIIARARARFIY